MWCKKCKIIMGTGTEYHPKKDNRDKGYRRYHECRRCGEKIFTKEPNFQESINKVSEKCRNK